MATGGKIGGYKGLGKNVLKVATDGFKINRLEKIRNNFIRDLNLSISL